MALEDYFRKFEEVLEGLDEKDPWPTKEDLKPGSIYIDQKSYSNIQSFLRDCRYCLLEGAERRGKTTLVRLVGFSYIEDWYVAQVDVSRVKDTSDIAPFIAQLEKSQDLPKTLIVIEDCHMSPEITRVLLRAAEKCREASFLFTMRTVKQGRRIPVEDPFEGSIIREQDWVVRLDEDNEAIYKNTKGIGDKFCEIHSSDLQHKSTKATPTSDDYWYLVEKTGSNKRILNYYLEVWSRSEDPDLLLRQVDKKLVLERFYQERLKGLTEAQLEVLKPMSVLGQFEIPILIQPLFPSDVFHATQEISGLKGLAFKLPLGAWLLADTESRLTLECLEYLKVIKHSIVYEVLRTYAREAPNYSEVFHSLHRAQERDLLILLAEDAEVHNSLVSRLRNVETTLGEMLYVLRAIGWADNAKGLDLWREYKKAFGEQFPAEVQRKLSETGNIMLTGLLLQFLKTIDREGEAIPLAKDLPDKLLVSQASLEVVGMASLSTIVRLLHNLAPEKDKQMLRGLDESDYKRLGEKARQVNLQTVYWFLRRLARDEQLKGFTDHFLKAIGQDALIQMASVSDIGTITRFRQVLDRLNTDTTREISNSLKLPLSDEEWIRLGEKARQASLQTVYWYLRQLASDEQSKGFADHFLKAIGQDALIHMASVSTIRITRNFRNTLGRLNTDTTREISNSLKLSFSDEEWIEKWTDETVGRQSWRLWGWARNLVPELRGRGKRLAKRLASADTALHFNEAEVAKLVEKLGWLLYGAYYLNEEAAKDLALKVVQVFDARSMRYSLEQLVFLLNNSRWCNPDAAQLLVKKILSTDAAYLLSKGELDWFCQLLWGAVLSDESRTKEWVTEVGESFWEDLPINAPPSDAFRLLLVLWQANGELGRRVTHAVGQRLLKSPELMDFPQAVPLLGFFAFCGLEPQVALSFSLIETVDKLYIHPASQRLTCSLFYLQESKPEAIPSFIKAILALKRITPRIVLLLAEHPLPWTALALADILLSAKSESREESEDVYDRMILLFKTIQRRLVYLGTLFNEMRAPQFVPQSEITLEAKGDNERKEAKTRSWATIRLMNAIDKGIVTVQKMGHPITSRLLNLNQSHPQVILAFDIAGNLLRVLQDAQIGKGWVDCNAWDAAFRGSWKGKALPPQQLRYWQGILLRMDMVKADYKETDKGDWTIVFDVNIDHPLVKSIITA